jgi:tRNA (guanine37-N1)-methyltransferase
MKRFHVVTIFPEIFDSYIGESLFKRAQEKKLLSVQMYNLRDFSNDRHQKVDDRPFGGGPGMVFKVEPVYRAVAAIMKKIGRGASRKSSNKKDGAAKQRKVRTILFSTRGEKLDAKIAQRLARYDDLILICGRYEGVDERVAEHIADEEISIGDFVLSGGELPALVLTEAVGRFIPGFLGKGESLEEINGSFPTYTRPEIFKTKKGRPWIVPKVLLSGDPKKITEWRRKPQG